MARLIDMDELLNEFEALKNKAETLRDAIYLDAVMAVIDTAPTIDAAPVVHGEWIFGEGEDVDIQCSICGADAMTEGDYRQVESNFCPNCGAKMDMDDSED